MNFQSLIPREAAARRRSRNGCVTCKRRKVRCNEMRPRCYHCHRLNLECVWKESAPQRLSPAGAPADAPADASANARADARGHDHSQAATHAAEQAAEQASASTDNIIFDFAQSVVDGTMDLSSFQDIYFPPVILDFPPPPAAVQSRAALSPPNPATPSSAWTPTQSPATDVHVDDDSLPLDLPPILDPIENGPKCASVKALFHGLAAASPMFRHAITAFSTIQSSTTERVKYKPHYDKAADDLSERFENLESGTGTMTIGLELRYVLATIFFLTYINLLTGQLDMACSNLEKAHHVLQVVGMGALGPIEQRIVSWIRLLDARAASAGGAGVLVNDTSSIIYPLTPTGSSPESSGGPASNSGSHEIIYEMLCQPGIVFYQEVQTITVRITRIAHVHRSRGSVEDETEVMAIAATILRDLSSLYNRRPAIMDSAVSGSIGQDILAQPLASAIVRSYQTYLANFYACHIHLHRVAHRHLARSKDVLTALAKIKEIVHLMASRDECIMVNMLWPLFLWGSEEDDQEECQWILKTIRSLHNIVTNANMTANVLQEIQARQQEAGWRVDIRSVCLELFNTTFAIV